MPGRDGPVVWSSSVDVILAAIAGGLVLAVFYPLTLCATGVKGLVKAVRPHLASAPGRGSITHIR
jgi:hypothetical protein